MKYQSFITRILCLLLIIGAILGYNLYRENSSQTEEIDSLKSQVEELQSQQEEILSAIQEAAKTQEEAKAKAEEATSASTSDTSGDSSADTSTEETSGDETTDEDLVYKDGTYTGEAQGYGGTIQVQITLASDEITDIQVTSAPGEDSAYLAQGEGVISSILSAQSTDVDTISGATFSSTGIINAVVDALGKAEN